MEVSPFFYSLNQKVLRGTITTLKKNRETVNIYASEKDTLSTILNMKIKDVK